MRASIFLGSLISVALGCARVDYPGGCDLDESLCSTPDATSDSDEVAIDTGAAETPSEAGDDVGADTLVSDTTLSDTTADSLGDSSTADADGAVDGAADADAGTTVKGWTALPAWPVGLAARVDHTAVWTGSEMIVFGGAIDTEVSPAATNTGAAFKPATNSWRTIAAAPSARMKHAAAWSGGKMIIWGGTDGTSVRTDGAAYDPVADTWSVISACPLTARDGMGAVWSTSTSEFIVWGGAGGCSGTSGIYCADGAAYSPSKDEWNMLPAAPIAGRTKHAMVWTGSSAAIWGGVGKPGTTTNDGALYDPLAKVWTTMAATPTALVDKRSGVAVAGFGNELYVWGGQASTIVDGSYYRNDGGHLKISTWTTSFAALPATVLSTPKRALSTAWFGSGRLFVWSGVGDVSGSIGSLPGGASYDPNFDTWAPMLNAGEPSQRVGATIVWTGKSAIVFGGKDGTTLFKDGGTYVP